MVGVVDKDIAIGAEVRGLISGTVDFCGSALGG